MMKDCRFADLSLKLSEGWYDITHDLPDGSPCTLAKDDGVGALQFSVARYSGGPRPSYLPANLRGGQAEELGDGSRVNLFERPIEADKGILQHVFRLLPAPQTRVVAEHLPGELFVSLARLPNDLPAGLTKSSLVALLQLLEQTVQIRCSAAIHQFVPFVPAWTGELYPGPASRKCECWVQICVPCPPHLGGHG